MTQALRWGILGPGQIARRFAEQLPTSGTGALAAVASRSEERGRAFAAEFGAQRVHDGYAALIADPDIDAVYIATPHTEHARWTIAALRAGKRVLCEKPLTPSPEQTMVVLETARASGAALLEGYMYRFHPQIETALRLIADGEIGAVQHVEASFSFSVPPNEGRLFDPALAGGGILDVGGYPLSLVRFVASAAGVADAAVTVKAAGTVRDDGVDEWATASLELAGGITAHVSCGIRIRDDNRARIVGSRGVITIPQPWVVASDEEATLDVRIVGEAPQTMTVEPAAAYALEADALAAADGQCPQVAWADSAAIAAWQRRWRDALGAHYPQDAMDAVVPTVSGEPLRRSDTAPMTYARVHGVDKPVSRLVMGCDNQLTLGHASAMFDDFVERGGNTFDTAFVYGRGLQEKLVGRWMENRGIRDDVVLIGKGAHSPYCYPDSIDAELMISLERLRTDHVDLYFMHRDNLDVPVGEFVDVLDAHVRAGRIAAFGGSNWTTARIDEANAYAEANGKHGFSALSNHFGLARAIELPWAGCEHATDEHSKAWLERTGTPLFPWSSQARGFFSRADPADTSDQQLVRCYYADDNFERLARARELAERRGVTPTAIALAYVLQQPFPTFPLIGPRSIAETSTSLEALSIELAPQEVRWLDLRE